MGAAIGGGYWRVQDLFICMGVLYWGIMAWHSSTIEAWHITSRISKNRFTCDMITQIKRELTLADTRS